MIRPQPPATENQRIAALGATGLLDTDPEERFDRYTRLTRRLLNMPIALVSLVDAERQWFKSRQGLAATETPRDVSFCGHAILENEVMVIEDARLDARFHDNPLVTGDPKVQFYAGAPLTSPDGHTLGTLCVIDHEPRSLDADDVEALKDIAAMVSGELAALQMATLDNLTGLSNRRGFEMLMRQALHACARHDTSAVLTMIDLDGFKAINDQLGHAAGDNALIEFADVLSTTFRESDVIARLGGDEFCVLLTDTDTANAWHSIERFRATLDARNADPRSEYKLHFSAGVTDWDPEKHATIDDLLAVADRHMYERKRKKRAGRAPTGPFPRVVGA